MAKIAPSTFQLLQKDEAISKTVSSWAVFMGGRHPAEAQERFLEAFRELYEQAADGACGISPDMILQGAIGSGRTEVLYAAAIYAAIVRGQKVLFLTASQGELLMEQMNRQLQEARLSNCCSAGILNPHLVDSWLDDRQAVLPNILFASDKALEAAFFSGRPGDKQEILRDILLSYTLILSDDFLSGTIFQRARRAFILDKLRLLLASENILGQFVVATPPLNVPYGVENLAERLFGLAQFDFTKNTVDLSASDALRNQYALLPDSSALGLCASHFCSVLPLLPKSTPIPASIFEQFGISLNHPACKAGTPGHAVATLAYDRYDAHDEARIWPCYVVADSTNATPRIDLQAIPSTQIRLYHDTEHTDCPREFLTLAVDDKNTPLSTAIWKDSKGNPIGECPEMDLVHARHLTLPDNGFSVAEIQKSTDPKYAMTFIGQPRRTPSYDIPVHRFTWNIPVGFQTPDMKNYLNEMALFSIRQGDSGTTRISAQINGLMTHQGAVCNQEALAGTYAFEAFISCIAFLPETAWSEEQLQDTMAGDWSTEFASGFSSALTYGFTIALRRKIPDISDFAMTPVFTMDGRGECVGRLLLWLVEPCDSGCTVYPVLGKKLLPEAAFRQSLLEEVKSVLAGSDGAYATLEELRVQSQMAFIGEEKLSRQQWNDEIERGLEIIRLLLDTEARQQDMQIRQEARKLRAQQGVFTEAARPNPEDIDAASGVSKKQVEEFERFVDVELLQFKNDMDLSHFGRDYGWSAVTIRRVFENVLWNAPEFFFVSRCHHHYHWTQNDKGDVATFTITGLGYSIRKEEYKEAKNTLEQEAEKALRLVKDVNDDVKKALLLHDYIVRNCTYDKKASTENDSSPLARTVYSVLVRHSAVCEGYTMAYNYLLKRVGIQSREITSDSMRHCWNYVKVNGNWYHVDVTWDDPAFHDNQKNEISHRNFLMSDAKAERNNHYNWIAQGLPKANATNFDYQDWKRYE